MKLSFAVAIGLASATLASGSARAQASAGLRRALCPQVGPCEVESVLLAGTGPGGEALAVVRLRLGQPRCAEGERPYQDWLADLRPGRERPLRELVYGPEPCLEWEESSWSFEGGELVFHHGGMGAPPSASTDLRRVHTRFRPWPLALTGERRGDEPSTAAPLPAEGPLFILSMDEEGVLEDRRRHPERYLPQGWRGVARTSGGARRP